jgi:hypothetical protein
MVGQGAIGPSRLRSDMVRHDTTRLGAAGKCKANGAPAVWKALRGIIIIIRSPSYQDPAVRLQSAA